MAKSPSKPKKTAKKQKLNEIIENPIKMVRQRAQRSSKPNRFYFNDDFDAADNDREILKSVTKASAKKPLIGDVAPPPKIRKAIDASMKLKTGALGNSVPEVEKPITKLSAKKSVQKCEIPQKSNSTTDHDVVAKYVPKPLAGKSVTEIEKSITKLSAKKSVIKCGMVSQKSNSTTDHDVVAKTVPKPPAKKLISIKKHEAVSSNKKRREKPILKEVITKPNSSKNHASVHLSEPKNRKPDQCKKDHSKKFIRLRYELDFAETGNDINLDDYVKYLMNNMKIDGRKNNLENITITKRNNAKVEVMAKVNFQKKSLRYLSEKFLEKQHLKYKVVSKNKRSYKIILRKG